jgi:hypothetical protein
MLLSADFFDSDYIQGTEFAIALERHINHEALVIGVVIRDCGWEQTDLEKFQVLSTEMPIARRRGTRDTAYKAIVTEIMRAANNFVPNPPKLTEYEKKSPVDNSTKNGTDKYEIPLPYVQTRKVDDTFLLRRCHILRSAFMISLSAPQS